MGSTEFYADAFGRNAAEAFRTAQDQARHEEGHNGYTGTVAEAGGYHEIQLPTRVTATKALTWAGILIYAKDTEYLSPANRKAALAGPKKIPAQHLYLAERIARYLDDKFGPCACLKLNKGETKKAKEAAGLKGTQKLAFVFAGLASC